MEHQPATKIASDTSDNLVIDLVVDFVEKEEDASMSDPGHVELKEKHTLSNLNSSSVEEVEEGGEAKKRKKKGLKDKIKGKISRDDGCKDANGEDHKLDNQEALNSGEKKGFLDKIIKKLPGQHHKKSEEGTATDTPSHESPSSGDEKKEKKGIFDKIKEKLPGHHKNDDEAKKDK